MYEGLDTVVLYEELAYEDVLPVAWIPMAKDFDQVSLGAHADRNLRILQALSALDEHGPIDKPDEKSPNAADLLRLELKLNLLLDMVGALLVTSQPRPPASPIRFNALGATWHAAAPMPQPGQHGILQIHVRDCIAEPLRLPGRVTTVTADGRVKVRFVPADENIADLMEKLAFRKHRRQVAGARQRS